MLMTTNLLMEKMKKSLIILFAILAVPMTYILLGLFGGMVSFAPGSQGKSTQSQEYILYVSSGDIHSEFVFDLAQSPYDWESFLPLNLVSPFSLGHEMARYLAIGWGSKRFFYEFLTWDDLSIELAVSATLLGGPSAVHAEYSEQLRPELRYYEIKVSKENYLKLVQFIQDSFLLDSNDKVQKIDNFNYFGRDSFFWGRKSYHLFRTCNMWTAEGLEVMQVRRPVWAPFHFGIDRALRDQRFKSKALAH